MAYICNPFEYLDRLGSVSGGSKHTSEPNWQDTCFTIEHPVTNPDDYQERYQAKRIESSFNRMW